MKDYELIDNESERQYEFHIDGYTPKIEYAKTNKGEIYLTHTEVPVELEGEGIASALVKKVLQDIEKKDLILVPMCPFVVDYIQKHPEWERLLNK